MPHPGASLYHFVGHVWNVPSSGQDGRLQTCPTPRRHVPNVPHEKTEEVPMRTDGRANDQLRPLTFKRGFTGQAAGSVLVNMGRTMVLCTCTVEEAVPPFLVGTGKGWLTAEYSMLPGSTS